MMVEEQRVTRTSGLHEDRPDQNFCGSLDTSTLHDGWTAQWIGYSPYKRKTGPVIAKKGRTCRTCPADFCRCPPESSDLVGRFVQQGSIHIWFPTMKQERPLIFTSHQLGKMSDRGWKCLAERWRPAGHFVWHARNNFRNHCRTRFSCFARYEFVKIHNMYTVWIVYTTTYILLELSARYLPGNSRLTAF